MRIVLPSLGVLGGVTLGLGVAAQSSDFEPVQNWTAHSAWIRTEQLIQQKLLPIMETQSDWGIDPRVVLEQVQDSLAHLYRTVPESMRTGLSQRAAPLTVEISWSTLLRDGRPDNLLSRRTKFVAAPKFESEAEKWRWLVETLTTLGTDNPQGQLWGLIKELPSEYIESGFLEPSDFQKLEFLKSVFKTQSEWMRKIEGVEARVLLQEQLISLVADMMASDHSELRQTSLNYTNTIAPWFKKFNARLTQSGSRFHFGTTRMHRVVKQLREIGFFLAPPKVRKRISLQELDPWRGALRSCLGNDCASRRSATHVLSPDVYVFEILDAQGRPKGYLELATVQVRDKKGIYVSSIQGPRISETDVHAILWALDQLKSRWGAELLVLPNRIQLKALINFEGIRRAMDMWSKPNEKVFLRRPVWARTIRHELEIGWAADDQAQQYQFDFMKRNKVGFIAQVPLGPTLSPKVSDLRWIEQTHEKIDWNKTVRVPRTPIENFVQIWNSPPSTRRKSLELWRQAYAPQEKAEDFADRVFQTRRTMTRSPSGVWTLQNLNLTVEDYSKYLSTLMMVANAQVGIDEEASGIQAIELFKNIDVSWAAVRSRNFLGPNGTKTAERLSAIAAMPGDGVTELFEALRQMGAYEENMKSSLTLKVLREILGFQDQAWSFHLFSELEDPHSARHDPKKRAWLKELAAYTLVGIQVERNFDPDVGQLIDELLSKDRTLGRQALYGYLIHPMSLEKEDFFRRYHVQFKDDPQAFLEILKNLVVNRPAWDARDILQTYASSCFTAYQSLLREI